MESQELERHEHQLERMIQQSVHDGDRLAQAVREVIFEGRRAERKLWLEYRRRLPDSDVDNLDEHESWDEGEGLSFALDNLEALLAEKNVEL